jgi:hypothetical protein
MKWSFVEVGVEILWSALARSNLDLALARSNLDLALAWSNLDFLVVVVLWVGECVVDSVRRNFSHKSSFFSIRRKREEEVCL